MIHPARRRSSVHSAGHDFRDMETPTVPGPPNHPDEFDPDRRTATKMMIAAAATPLLLHRTVDATGIRTEPIRLGMIGYGIRGKNLLDQFLRAPGVRFVGLAEVCPARRDVAMRRIRDDRRGEFCDAYVDGFEMLREARLDAVVVTTPDHAHAVNAIEACRRGLHVYCEKPLSRTIAEGRAIADAAAASKVAFQVGSQQRTEFGRHFARAAELVRNGSIGRVERVFIGVGDAPIDCDLPAEPLPEDMTAEDWDRWLGPAASRDFNAILCPVGMHGHYPQWRRYRQFAGGGLADMGAHHFDIAQWALRRDASGPSRIIPPEDPAASRGLRLVYDDGIELVHDGSIDCRFEGDAGWIEAGRGYLRASDPAILETEVGTEHRLPRPADHITDWIDAIGESRPTIAPAEAGHRTATICQLAAIGYELGTPLTWDPRNERFTGDHAEAANALRTRPGRTTWTGHGTPVAPDA